MTQAELVARLSPGRLPIEMLAPSPGELLALVGFGLLLAALLVLALRPLLARRTSRRARIRATRGLESEARLLAVARILGHLPAELAPAAYGAVPPPPPGEVERIAGRARRRR